MQEVSGVLGGALSGTGTLGASAGVPAGLAGLFAMLLGGQGGSAGLGVGLGGAGEGDPLAGLLAGLQAGGEGGEADAALLAKLGLPADGTVTQETVVVQAVLVQLKQTVMELQQAGVTLEGLGDSTQLAAAFETLGMSREEAAGKALEIEQMLDFVKEYLGAGEDATPGGLLEMIAASSTYLTPLNPTPVMGLTVTQTEVTVATVEISSTTVTAAAAKAFAKPAAGVGLARVMTGIDDAPLQDEKDLLSEVELDEGGELSLEMHADHVPDLLPVEAVVKPDTPAAVATVAAAAPELPKVVKDTDKNDVKIQAGRGTATAVAPERVALPPEGTEVMRVRADAEGAEVAERKLDAATLRSMNAEAGPAPTGPDAGQQGLIADKMQGLQEKAPATFAERLAQATRADVTQQTVVQVKQVIEGGGGTVRMILNPPELGEIRIEMTISNGKVEGAISATDNAVVELLARDVHSLKQGLAEAGLKLGDQGLALMLNNGNQQNPQGQHGQNAQAGNHQANGLMAGTEEAIAAEIALQNGAHWVAPDQLVDVRI